jgi:hypothetical protein
LRPDAPYFIFLLCLMPDNFTRQGERAGLKRNCAHQPTYYAGIYLKEVANKSNKWVSVRVHLIPVRPSQSYTAISIKIVHEQSGKVEYERERLLGIVNKLMNFQSDSQQPFALVFDFSALLADNLNWNSCMLWADLPFSSETISTISDNASFEWSDPSSIEIK